MPSAKPATPAKPEVTPYDELKLNQIRARGSHNSYQRDEDIADQLVFWRLRHVELDLHTSRERGPYPVVGFISEAAPNGDWWVYHVSYPFEDPNVRTFSDGLKLLAGFHKAVPQHEVTIVALDIKNHFESPQHTPAKLDALILKYLPGAVWTPRNFLDTLKKPTKLQDGSGKWPLIKDLRGKFIFILTTGDLKAGSQLAQYIAGGAGNRTCFVAPEISSKDAITDPLNKDVVFFNTTVDNAPVLGPAVFNAGFISRAYGANDQAKFDKAKAAKSHLIGTDNVNTDKDPWSRTHNTHGWPFQPVTSSIVIPDTLVEAGSIYQIIAQSGDVYGSEDNGLFPHAVPLALTGRQTVTYTFAVAVPSSHVPDKNGKAGIMVRAALGDRAANFAVLRVADNNEPRVQVRKKAGASTDQYKLNNDTTISGESWMFLQLKLSNGGKTAEGLTSYDGTTWVSLHKETFAEPLVYPGIVCSSHDKDKPTRYDVIPYVANQAITFNATRRLGNVAIPPSEKRNSLNLP